MSEADICVDMYLCNKDIDIIYDANNNDEVNLRWTCSTTIVQCAEALHTNFDANSKYEKITSPEIFIKMIKLIKNKTYIIRVKPYLNRSLSHAPNI